MTRREDAVLDAINLHYAHFGVPPTIRYIMERTNIPSSDSVHRYYCKLAENRRIVLAGSPGSQPKPVPSNLFELIKKEFLPHENHHDLDR